MKSNLESVDQNISRLKVSAPVQQGLREFVSQIIDLYADDLVSISVIGSTVTGDYDQGESDVNLLVVYSDMDLVELERVAELSRHWLRRQKFAPRFITRRNLTDSVTYFQVDFLAMRDAHVVLWGEDVLAGIEMRKSELRWQIAYQVKAMRMRIKQQFWRTAHDPERMRAVMIDRFTSLIHLMRGLLLLYDLPAPVTRRETLDLGVKHFRVDPAFVESMLELRRSQSLPDSARLTQMFTDLMDMIRTIDARVDEVKL